MSSNPGKKRPRRERREKAPRKRKKDTAAAELEPASTPTPEPGSEEDLQAPGGETLAAPETVPPGSPGLEPEGEEVIELEGGPGEVEMPEEEAAETSGEGEDEHARYRRGLFRSRRVLSKPFTRAATRKAIDPEFWNEAEEAFIAADTGVAAAGEIVERARKRIHKQGIRDMEGIKQAFRDEVVEMLESFGEPPEPSGARPRVLFVVGVNGVGKTTTCAKLGYDLKQVGKKVLFAAADTFRAAGIEQMEMWANRVGAPVVRHKLGGDPAAVVFDSIESAQAKNIDVVVVDTAGRLHTKKNLMDELNKMWRVADRQLEGSPEALLVIDATTGQNGVAQARIFGEALEIGSIALTKMDGSARGGVVLAIGRELGIPVSYIGVGEGMADLRPFDPHEYASALF
jgi:fused signal recognition particle receptor